MAKEFIEVVRVRFSGSRYSEHKLDGLALRELINLQEFLYQSVEISNKKEYGSEQELSCDDKEKYAIYQADLMPRSTIVTLRVRRDNSGYLFDYLPAHEEVEDRMSPLVNVSRPELGSPTFYLDRSIQDVTTSASDVRHLRYSSLIDRVHSGVNGATRPKSNLLIEVNRFITLCHRCM